MARSKKKTKRISGATVDDASSSLFEAKSACREEFFGDSRAVNSCIVGAINGHVSISEGIEEKFYGAETGGKYFDYDREVCGDQQKNGVISNKIACVRGVNLFEKKIRAKRPKLASVRYGMKRC